ncbi:zinc finger protein 436-like isoform X2 [Hemicordylus capensis]|uniref:zinc finger protein 436-like isoform X2 n=1 Tax=Hemicordylus capensis TaxID=884348 RepID=UPI002302B168|nr:zinc finger protein 436-like isoform X2 [Hemicordylus capensis]
MAADRGNELALDSPVKVVEGLDKSPEPEKEVGINPCDSQAGSTREFWERTAPQQVKQESNQQLQQCWEAKFQGFVKALESPPSDGTNSQLLQFRPRDKCQALLSSFGDGADPNQHPDGEKMAPFPPGLCMESQRTDANLLPHNKRGSGEVKEENVDREAVSSDTPQQHFRQFCYQEADGPRVTFRRLWEFCHRWLRPETHTKEQILSLVILEQFLTVLPQEMQSWVRRHSPETCSQAVALAEDFLLKQQEDEKQEEPTFKEIVVNFPEVEMAETSLWQRPLFGELKQENDWDATSLGDEMVYENEETQHKKSTEQEPDRMLAGRPEKVISPSPDQDDALDSQQGSQPEKEGDLFIRAQGTYEELPGMAVPQEISRGFGEMIPVEWGESFRQSSDLIVQERSHPVEKKYKCLDCGRCFGQHSHLITHKKIHTGEKPYPCLECGKSFRRRAHLVEHERIHTGEKPYKCPECEKGFCDRSSFNTHARIHTGEKPYKCTDCGKCYSRHASLADHKRTHTGEKPYKCLECEKCFSGRSNFNAHKRIHVEEKPHKCADCGKTFTRLSNLTDHRRTHTGEKPYKCKECGKGFSCSSLLIKHKRNHTGEKPYLCSECGKSFSMSFILIRHKRIHSRGKVI